MRSAPQPPIFILEGLDVGIYDDVEQAELELEPIDVNNGIYQGYDAHARHLRIRTDGIRTFIELNEDQPSGSSSFESDLRTYLVHLGEDRAAEADCDLPCLIEMAQHHAELNRRALQRAARDIQTRYRSAFQERGGELQVSASKASDLGTRTKLWGLYAEVEWEASRLHEHVHAEIAHRPWFSQRWTRVRSLSEATGLIEAKLTEWLRQGS